MSSATTGVGQQRATRDLPVSEVERRGRAFRRREPRHRRLLGRADKEPAIVLSDRRCLKPGFCREFFDLCDGKALEQPDRAVEYAEVALELAEQTGDPHLIHDARGVLVHALIGCQRRAEASQVLAKYRSEALGCCRHCEAEWYRRQGDLLVEDGQTLAAGEALEHSVERLGDKLTGDRLGRLCFVRGIQHHYRHEREQAIDDAGTALLQLSFDSPRGYFLDTLCLMACFLRGRAEPRHIEQAMAYAQQFRPRLKGRRDVSSVLSNHRWLEGQLYARLGDAQRGINRLESVRGDYRRSGPSKRLAAVTLDQCLVLARRVHDVSRRRILSLLKSCVPRLKDEPVLKKSFESAIRIASRDNEKIHGALLARRVSFIVPMPGIVAELPKMGVRDLEAESKGLGGE